MGLRAVFRHLYLTSLCFYLQLCGEHSTSHSDLHLYLVSQIRRISLISSLAAGSQKAEWRPENKRRCQSTSPASSQPNLSYSVVSDCLPRKVSRISERSVANDPYRSRPRR